MRSTATILLMFAFGYFMSALFRAVNAVIAPDLVADVGLDAAMLGLLTSALLIAHAGTQLPLGVALDRFGPRRVQTVMFCAAAVGAILFSVGGDAVTLTLARALVGAGFGGALMSGFKAVTLSLPGPRQALGNAMIMGGGQIGYIVATWPAEMMVGLVGWRMVFAGLAAMTLVAAALYWMLVPDWPREGRPQRFRDQLLGLGQVFADPVTWRVAPVVWTTAGLHIAMLTLWAGPWFRDVAGLDRAGVATGLLINATSAVVGVLIGGWLADRLARRGIGLLRLVHYLLIVFTLAQIPIFLALTTITPFAWVMFSVGGQWGILTYPWLAAYFGKGLSGRAQTGVNTGIFVYAFFIQYLSGEIIDLFEPTASGGYDPAAYQVCFAVFFALQVAALGWFVAGRRMMERRHAALERRRAAAP
jgi:predicted MFS family arabinose efflux permease